MLLDERQQKVDRSHYSRGMAPPRIFGSHELAQRWGVTRARIFQLLQEDARFPQGEKLKGAHVWTIEEIQEYERVAGRKPRDGDTPDPAEPPT